jgi:K+-transporting ATPase ATPase C chain
MKPLVKDIKLHFVTLLIFGIGFPFVIWLFSLAMPNSAAGYPVYKNGQIVGFENIGQKFHTDGYFWGRPSAVDYNASATGGSNKAVSDSAYQKTIRERLEEFLRRNPGITKEEVPSDIITASSSGVDPDISTQAAIIQIKRVAKARNLPDEEIMKIVIENVDKPLFGVFGTSKVNVFKLNLSLDYKIKEI